MHGKANLKGYREEGLGTRLTIIGIVVIDHQFELTNEISQ